MLALLRPCCCLFLLLTILTGMLYPALVTVLGQLVCPHRAQGSLIRDPSSGRVVGSELIGQSFTEPRYLWGRPSATSPQADNAASSSGSNLGPANPDLMSAIGGRVAALRSADPGLSGVIPGDLVTASASGLDPDISPAAAEIQVPRIAQARGLSRDAVRTVIQAHRQDRQFGVLGEPRVNVLAINLALDRLSDGRPAPQRP